MAWKRSITGTPLFWKLLEDDDPASLDPQRDAAAVENIEELGRLAAYKAFCAMSVWHETRRSHYEDAIQEAISSIWRYRERGPRTAYGLAKKRLVNWIIEYVWQGKQRRTQEEKRLRLKTLLQLGPSLDAFEGQPCFISEWVESDSPEEELLGASQRHERAACIAAFYDVIIDLVANRMNLARRRHYTARNDALIFWLTLQGYSQDGIARELGISYELAGQQMRYARRRLEEFLAEQGLDEVAAWYRGVAEGEQGLDDARTKEVFVSAFVQRACDQFQQASGTAPDRRRREHYKLQARQRWQTRQTAQERVAAD